MPEMYLVGGAVRDMQLGLAPKDYDFTVVADSYADMKDWLMREFQAEIFLEKEEFGTIRASVSSHYLDGYLYPAAPDGMIISRKRLRLAADFVLARKDGAYSDGRHPDEVEVGSLYDDLARRDFTMNAMALGPNGVLIDPFGGRSDLEERVIVAVGSANERLIEDSLRAVRAIRFAVTKDMRLSENVSEALSHAQVLYNLEYVISVERVREELLKAFKYDTLGTLRLLEDYRLLRVVLFGPNNNLWLKPTLED